MRALGALSVVLGCGLLGFIRAAGLSRQEKCLRAVIDSLQYIISELRTEAPPLPELLNLISQTAGTGIRPFYKRIYASMELLGDESFETLWTSAVLSSRELSLDSNQRHILCKAGVFMGKFSVEEQAAALSSCILRLEHEHRLAVEKSKEGKKLYPGLGVAAGIMLAAMFL